MLQDARMAAMRKLHRIVGSRGESPVRAVHVDRHQWREAEVRCGSEKYVFMILSSHLNVRLRHSALRQKSPIAFEWRVT
jgi:hypothetical protein